MSEKRMRKGDLALNWGDIPHTSGSTAHETRCRSSESAVPCDGWPSLGPGHGCLVLTKVSHNRVASESMAASLFFFLQAPLMNSPSASHPAWH